MLFQIKDFIAQDISSVISFGKFLKHEGKKVFFNFSKGRTTIKFILLTIFGIIVTHISQHYGNSISMTTLTYILVFDLLSLFVLILTVWIEHEAIRRDDKFFAYKRYEVIAVFTTTVITQISALFVIKESIERIFLPEVIKETYMGAIAGFTLFIHCLLVFGTENTAINRVIEMSSSSWLQEHITDISEGLCHYIPSLSSLLLPRINPVNLLGGLSSLVVICVDIAMRYGFTSIADTLGAMAISIMIIATMTPLSVLSGRVLLQTCPGHLIAQIDQALRAASSFDGVLEIQREHFWSLGFKEVFGSVHVRVRRDANEQLVLAHVTNKLQPLVTKLTVQIFKDSWTRATPTNMNTMYHNNEVNHHHPHPAQNAPANHVHTNRPNPFMNDAHVSTSSSDGFVTNIPLD